MADNDPTIGAEPESRSLARRHMLRGLAGLGAAGVVGVAAAQPAGADDGDSLVLGQNNTSTSTTRLTAETGDDYGLAITADGYAALAVTALEGANYAIAATHESTDDSAFTIFADAITGTAIAASNNSDLRPALAAVNQGESWGLAAMTGGDGGQLLLDPQPGSAVGPPTSGSRVLGEIRMDLAGDLWVCVEKGTPGAWTRLLREDTASGRTVPIAPFRALDTRATGGRPSGSPAVPGQKKGPLKGGEAITLDLAGVAPISATATGVIGNLIAITPSYTGYLRAAPSGSPLTATALSFAPGPNTGNAFTVGLGPAGVTLQGSGTLANTYHLVVDITAYLT